MIALRRLGLVVAVLLTLGAQVTARPATSHAPVRMFVGSLLTNPANARADARAGLTMAMLQVGWKQAQPVRGRGLSRPYVAELRRAYATYRAAGLAVTLDPGLQYPPDWIFRLDGRSTRFIDQYGNVWRGGPGEDVPDAVHDPAVRRAERSYLSLLSRALEADSFAAVRAGGLLDGELHLPPSDYDGHDDDWWSFGAAALDESGGHVYRPGISPDNPMSDAAFLRKYLAAVANYQDFIVEATARAFHAAIEVLYPSFGARPGDEQAAVRTGLDGQSPRTDEIVMGDVPALLVPRIPAERRRAGTDLRIVAYTTWLDGPNVGTTQQSESPIAYLASLATPRGIPLAGENTAADANSAAALALCATRARHYHLLGFMWFDDATLNQPNGLTTRDLARAVPA
jgi:hypothetical protein